MSEYLIQEQTLKATANKIRKKLGTTEAIKAEDFPATIENIPALADNSLPKETLRYPGISISSDGLITAWITQPDGYIEGTTRESTRQLTTQGLTIVSPSRESIEVCPKNVYTTDRIVANSVDHFYLDDRTMLYIDCAIGIRDRSPRGQTVHTTGDVSTTKDTYKFEPRSIRIPTNSSVYVNSCLNNTNIFTVEMWVYMLPRDGNANNLHCLWSHGGSNATAGTGGTLVWGGNSFGFVWGGNTYVLTTAANYATEKWHHVALVANATNLKLFVNGSLAAEADFPGRFSTATERFGMNDSDMTSAGSSDFYVQGIRISNQIRYVSSFTPPRERIGVVYT